MLVVKMEGDKDRPLSIEHVVEASERCKAEYQLVLAWRLLAQWEEKDGHVLTACK